MKKKVVAVLLMVSMVAALAIGCGSKKVKKTRELRKKQNMNKLWKREF